MNIFTALSQGKGSLNENNMSAMLSFLINPYQEHGLKDTFLKEFLKLLDELTAKELFENNSDFLKNKDSLEVEVTLESPYNYKGQKRYLDIEIQIYDDMFDPVIAEYETKEILKIAVENKIKPSSAQNDQFKQEYKAIRSEINRTEDKETKVLMVFLTPSGDFNSLKKEFDNLIINHDSNDEKVWLKWDAADDSGTLAGLLKSLLKSEANFEIDPISDYVRNTLKAFIRHIIETNIKFTSPERVADDLGDIKESVTVELRDGKYRIEKYESSSIKVYNLNEQEYEVAKPLLRKVIRDKDLDVSLYFDSGNKRNTRSLGRKVIKALKVKK
ncbi:PD-(D/E)XK nuclease family protein [Halanaerobium saccharolyticum]|uniref:PD-(D/E)XK nuclease family protein n=1 Tax=Halanaerobium saccharolyticum TaxID=43595 RepID=UPI003FCD6E7B